MLNQFKLESKAFDLNPFQSHCCEELVDRLMCGGSTVHARKCSADTGIFLKIRDCRVVLLSELKRGQLLIEPKPYKVVQLGKLMLRRVWLNLSDKALIWLLFLSC